jgi:hypothetical protein
LRGARAEEIGYKEGRGPHPATKDNAVSKTIRCSNRENGGLRRHTLFTN